MAATANSMSTRYEPETGDVIFAMLDGGGNPTVECRMPGEAAVQMLLLLAEMMGFDDDDDELEETVGHC